MPSDGIKIDRAIEKAVETGKFARHDGNQFVNVHTINTKHRKDILAQRDPTADNVLRCPMMLDTEFFP